jgi:hypothetical protein
MDMTETTTRNPLTATRPTAVQLLRITQCQDPQLWYAGMVGKLVPRRYWTPEDGYVSSEPAGFTNFVRTTDAVQVDMVVEPDKMGCWPYTIGGGKRVVTRPAGPKGAMPEYVKPAPGTPLVGHSTERNAAPDAAQALGVRICEATCARLGICQALDICQDKHRIDAQLGKTLQAAKAAKAAQQAAGAAPGQSQSHSWAEAGANIVVGFGVSVVITAWLLPAMGHQVSLSENVLMTSVFTVASLLRSYGVRRIFNRLQTKGAKRNDGLLQRD